MDVEARLPEPASELAAAIAQPRAEDAIRGKSGKRLTRMSGWCQGCAAACSRDRLRAVWPVAAETPDGPVVSALCTIGRVSMMLG